LVCICFWDRTFLTWQRLALYLRSSCFCFPSCWGENLFIASVKCLKVFLKPLWPLTPAYLSNIILCHWDINLLYWIFTSFQMCYVLSSLWILETWLRLWKVYIRKPEILVQTQTLSLHFWFILCLCVSRKWRQRQTCKLPG
jgi:hypothetical protein